MIRYRDLTDEEIDFICNGCGPKGGWVPVPEFFCHASCDHHDFNYWIGHTIADRMKADHQFLVEMLRDAGDNPAKQTIAITYWMAVRLFGAAYFHYAVEERDEKDLAKAMAQHVVLPGGLPDTRSCVRTPEEQKRLDDMVRRTSGGWFSPKNSP